MSGMAVLVAWAAIGLCGGFLIRRNNPITISGWLTAIAIGPLALLIGYFGKHGDEG